MKTITIQGNEITYDETLVHVFVGDNDVRVERVSRFNKWSQMPAYKNTKNNLIYLMLLLVIYFIVRILKK